MTGTSEVIAKRFRRPGSEENGPGMANVWQQHLRLHSHDFQMLRRCRIYALNGLLHVVDQQCHPLLLKRRPGSSRAWQRRQLSTQCRDHLVCQGFAVRHQNAGCQFIMFGLAAVYTVVFRKKGAPEA